jgi:hypothetical protein
MDSNLLGEVVTWDVRASLLSWDVVKDALRVAGLDPAAARELAPKSAFSRACKDFKKDRTIDKLEWKDSVVQFQFTKKTLSGGMWEFDYDCRVNLDTDSGTITCPENPELGKRAQDLFDMAVESRNAQDITTIVQGLFRKNAALFPINPRKGVAYFIPEEHREFTEKVDEFLKKVGGELSRFPVPKGTKEGNASVRDAVSNGLQELVNELNGAVEEWDETTRQTTMDRGLERIQLIQFKIDAYASYLESEQGRLLGELTQAKKRMSEKISSLVVEKETAVA